MKLLLALLALSCAAQPALDFSLQICPGATGAKVLLWVPAKVNQTDQQVMVPRCVQIGSGLRLTSTADGSLSLEATAMPTPNVRMVQDRIKLDEVPLDKVSIDHVLSAEPVVGSVLWAAYRGQTFWTQVFDTVQPNGKTITVKLPPGRMLRAGDTLILMYLTFDPISAVAVPARP